MLKIKDVYKMPKHKSSYPIINNPEAEQIEYWKNVGFNQALDEISNLPVDLSKVLDVEKIVHIILSCKWMRIKRRLEEGKLTFEKSELSSDKEIAQAIINNINDCFKEKK